jgi:DNA-binding transcriptional LysR family regulator
VGSLVVATVVGLGLVTNTTFTWLGWWADGVFESSSLGLFVAFLLAGLLYALVGRFAAPRRAPAEGPAPLEPPVPAASAR